MWAYLVGSIKWQAQMFEEMRDVVGLMQTAKVYAGWLLRRPEVKLRVKCVSTPVYCRPATSDRKVLVQIFQERDCDVDLKTAPSLIIDGGANVGYSSLFLANKYPEAEILAVEPDVENANQIRKNCATYPNIRVVQGGIWTRREPLYIANPDAKKWAFQLRASPSGTTEAEATSNSVLYIVLR